MNTPKADKTALHTLDRGAHFTFGGHRWVKLTDTDQDPSDGILALAVNLAGYRAFDNDNRNDWRGASLRMLLNDNNGTHNGFVWNMAKSATLAGENIGDAFLPIISDLTADDGMKDYGTAEDYIALLTCDLYRQHRDIIPPVDDWYWTLTPWTCRASFSSNVRNVLTSGALSYSSAYSGNGGVRPLCRLKFDTRVSTAEPEPQEEPDNRKYTTCAECGDELGDEYHTYKNDNLYAKYFHKQDGSDNAFCSEDCAGAALGLTTADNEKEADNGKA